MIRRIQQLQHIGVFNTDTTVGSYELKSVVLIYAKNGSGKTTLAEILRSLETRDAPTILQRRRLDSDSGPCISLKCDGSLVKFQNGSWHGTPPHIRVFDEIFVDKNVYSGLDVKPRHRKNLHDFVLGEKGVSHSQLLQKMVQQVEENRQKQRNAERRMPDGKLHGFSMDEFCNLSPVPDVENQIALARQKLEAAQEQDDIRSTELFETFTLPQFDIEAIIRILSADLPTLDKTAAARVSIHVDSLTSNAETWISDGMRHMPRGSKGPCPFCGQKITDASLVKHYRAYFGDEYARLKRNIGEMMAKMQKTHSEVIREKFRSGVEKNRVLMKFWNRFCNELLPEIDTESILNDWTHAYGAVLNLLKAKQASPLEPIQWNGVVLKTYECHRRQIADVNAKLNAINDSLKNMQARESNTDEITTKIDKLKAAKARHSQDISPICDEYMQAKAAKARAESRRDQANQDLKAYRKSAFPALCSEVNKYLAKFNTGFALDDIQPVTKRFGPSCKYDIRVSNRAIPAGESTSSSRKAKLHGPTFGHTLSTGDRDTLALALFFSSVAKSASLKDCVIVVDDPVSSLDEYRYTATAQELADLSKEAEQLFVLSHNKQFLSQVWREVGPKKCSSLLISHHNTGSVIGDYGINLETNVKQARWQCTLEDYVKDKNVDKNEVAAAIRLYLEASLERTCANHYRASQPFMNFINTCNDKPGMILDEAVVRELEKIYKYANQFHHGTRLTSQSEDIDPVELRGYARRVLAVMRPSVRKKHQSDF